MRNQFFITRVVCESVSGCNWSNCEWGHLCALREQNNFIYNFTVLWQNVLKVSVGTVYWSKWKMADIKYLSQFHCFVIILWSGRSTKQVVQWIHPQSLQKLFRKSFDLYFRFMCTIPKLTPYPQTGKSVDAIVNITIKNIVFILKSKVNSTVNQDLNRHSTRNGFGLARRKKLTKILCYKPMIEIRAQRSFKESIKFMLSGSVNMYPWKENISRFLQRFLCELLAEGERKE